MAIAGRRAAAVLLLFAVLSMHGLQCSSAMPSPAHADVKPSVSFSMTAAAGGGPAVAHVPHAAAAPSVDVVLVADQASAAPVGEHDSAPHGSGHLWAVCLAVLAAGLAVLLAVLAARLVPRRPATWKGTPSRAAGGVSMPRPPDLHALCLLRI